MNQTVNECTRSSVTVCCGAAEHLTWSVSKRKTGIEAGCSTLRTESLECRVLEGRERRFSSGGLWLVLARTRSLAQDFGSQ